LRTSLFIGILREFDQKFAAAALQDCGRSHLLSARRSSRSIPFFVVSTGHSDDRSDAEKAIEECSIDCADQDSFPDQMIGTGNGKANSDNLDAERNGE
jgi:hypothetical protein